MSDGRFLHPSFIDGETAEDREHRLILGARQPARRVGGEASVGDRVVYEDMANPRREGHVADTRRHVYQGCVEYLVVWDDGDLVRGGDPGFTWSDLRQHGWVFA